MSCPPGKIRNTTGRCVNIDGAIGRRLLKEQQDAKLTSTIHKGKIRNTTGRYVNIDGAIGKRLLKEQQEAKLTSTTKRKLLICHGSTYRKVPGWSSADTIDIDPSSKPTYVADILEKTKLSIIKHKYDEIMTVYCPYNVYIISSSERFCSGRQKVDMKPNRQFFVNVSRLLKRNGLLIINNFSLYLGNVKNNDRLTREELAQVFVGEISDLFEFVSLATNATTTLTLRKHK